MFIKAYMTCNTGSSNVGLTDPVFIRKDKIQIIQPHFSVRNVYQITAGYNNLYYIKAYELEEVPLEEAINHLALVETLSN